jgi:Phage phiEco32-like COOH.NH2 ligase-type 2
LRLSVSNSSKKDFKLGADPEMGFIEKGGRFISASEIVQDARHDEQFGVDGGGAVAEIRPTPNADPIKVVANIKRVMSEAAKNTPELENYDWKAGSAVENHPIGGHIHFGLKKIKKAYNTQEILDSLDRYLAQTLVLLEDPIEAKKRRIDNSYGGLGDYRDQPHGLEYRTPGSWLTSPYIAAGVLSLAKATVWEALYNGLGSHRDVEIDYDNFEEATLDPIRKQFDEVIWRDVQKFELYPKFQKSIDLLQTLIAKKKNWFPTGGMKAAWAIGNKFKLEPIKPTTLTDIWAGVPS